MPRTPFCLALTLAALTSVACATIEPGEILIGEMNCMACHEAASTVKERLDSRQSPKLGADGLRLTPQWLRAFLIDPQIETHGTLMPDMLHALPPPEKAEAADALTHFLVSLQPEDEPTQVGASSSGIKTGEQLYHSLGCVMCHAPLKLPPEKVNDAAATEELARLAQTSVPLGDLAKKYSVAELAAFLRDPVRTRPSGRMPSLKLNDGEARVIAMYLLREQVPAGEKTRLAGLAYDYYEKQLPELPQFDRLQPDATGTVENFTLSVAKRKNDFALRFRGVLTVPDDGDYKFYTTSDDGTRLYIDEKLIVENGGVHPAQERSAPVKLTAGEHTITVEYFDGGGNTAMKVQWKQPGGQREEIPENLLTHEGRAMRPLGDAVFIVDTDKAARGKELFAQFNCAACHQLEKPGVKARPLAELEGRQPAGCLATNPKAGVPKFDLNDRQRVVLLAQLGAQESLGLPLDAGDQIKRKMTVLNCFACHQRERRGGPDGLRRDYFASVGEVDLGDEGRIPPHLNDVGAKLQREWIEAVLLRGAAVRPYMATRMPLFGPSNVKKLSELFEKADAKADAPPQPDLSTDAGKFGRKLVGVGGLTCIACHNFSGNKSLGVPALDLALIGQRLKWDWFRHYLLDPQALRPGTRMPAFWPNGVAVNRDILGGDAEKQIAAIWTYLARKNFTDLPAGLVKGKEELIADTEAVIYRNFIEGAGPRAIGVGYPEKANLAFDANEMRLALLWQGAFIDAAKHHTGRGAGFEKPLGVNVIKGPAGPPFAVLESESASWPTAVGKEGRYHFQGYRLDDKRRPAFRYRFNDLEIEDYPIAVPGATDPGFKRTITITARDSIDRLYFRAAVADKIEAKGGAFFAGKMKLTFTGAKPLIRTADGKAELLVPLTFAGPTATLIEEIEW
jgi:mono/diheme cytochrome c family protein